MYRFIDGSRRHARGAAPATDGPSPDGDRHASVVRRVGTLAALLLVTAALTGCDEPESTWGSTETADREPSTPTERQATPPPTPDYWKLAASAEEDRPGRDGEAGDEAAPEQPLPRDVSYPEAESLYHQGDYDEALRHFEAYTRENPDNPWGHYMLGLSAWKAGDLERAVRGLEGALERDPDHVKSLVNLSRAFLELDRPEDAREPVRKALEAAPRSADALRVAGNVDHESGETETAIRRYRQALAADGSDAWSANNLGLLLVRQGRFDEALGPLARAVEIRPEVGTFRNNLGVALERTGHVAGARDQYRTAADAGHGKAEASLARLEGVAGDGTAGTVELDDLARRFADRVEGWDVDRLTQGPSPTDETEGTPGDAPSGGERADVIADPSVREWDGPGGDPETGESTPGEGSDQPEASDGDPEADEAPRGAIGAGR